MTETTPPSWQPDPYGRFAQRYWNGSAWTADVSDATGHQSIDPPGPSAMSVPAGSGVPAFGNASTPSGPPIPGLIAAGVGAVLLLLSLFVLNWYQFGSADKEQITANASDFESAVGISASDAVDGITFHEGKTLIDKGADTSTVSEQYFSWGYLLAIAAVGFVVVALFVPRLRWPAFVIALVFAAWHGYTVNDSGGEGASTEFGAWAGVAGLAVAAVALLLPRPTATT